MIGTLPTGMCLRASIERFPSERMPVRVKKTHRKGQRKGWSPALIPSKPE
jgi:hypothetical protein